MTHSVDYLWHLILGEEQKLNTPEYKFLKVFDGRNKNIQGRNRFYNFSENVYEEGSCFLGGIGRVPMYLHIICSMISSAPAPETKGRLKLLTKSSSQMSTLK